jgi:hypothetical protein
MTSSVELAFEVFYKGTRKGPAGEVNNVARRQMALE